MENVSRSLMVLLVLACVSLCAAQGAKSKSVAKPDFSGNWMLDHSKSNLGQLQRALGNAEIILVVAHREPELKITRRASVGGREQVQILTYYSDGRGETNPRPIGGGDIKTKTNWDKVKHVSRASTSITTQQGETIYLDTSEKRELSADGGLLTITTSISSPRGVQVIKQVYARAH